MRNISKEPCNIPKFVLIGIILLYQRSAQKTTKWIERKKTKTKTNCIQHGGNERSELGFHSAKLQTIFLTKPNPMCNNQQANYVQCKYPAFS